MIHVQYYAYLNIFNIFAIFCIFSDYFSLWGKRDDLVPLPPYLAGIFQHLRRNKSLPHKVRAVDKRHVFLVLPFLLNGLLEDVVLGHNRKHPL